MISHAASVIPAYWQTVPVPWQATATGWRKKSTDRHPGTAEEPDNGRRVSPELWNLQQFQ